MDSPRRVQPWSPGRSTPRQSPARTSARSPSGGYSSASQSVGAASGGRGLWGPAPSVRADVEGSRPALTRFPRRSQAIAADPYPWRLTAPRTQGWLANTDARSHPYGLRPDHAEQAVVRSVRTFRSGEYHTTHSVMPVDGLKSPARARSPLATYTDPSRQRDWSPARPTSRVSDVLPGSSPRSSYQRLQDRIERAKSPVRPPTDATQRPTTRSSLNWW
jgi:hypothetical protein